MSATQGERFHYMRTEILNLTQKQLAEKLSISQQKITDIENDKKKNIPLEVLEYLSKEFLINLEWLLFGEGESTKVETYEAIEHKLIGVADECDCVDIHYWEGLPEDLKRPQITSIHADLELLVTDWKRPLETLRAIPMLGSSMNTYFYPLTDRDILIVDLAAKDINKNGIYLFTTNDGKNLYIRFLTLLMDGSIKAQAFENNEEHEKIITPEEQDEFGFEVIGRVIKNVSLTI